MARTPGQSGYRSAALLGAGALSIVLLAATSAILGGPLPGGLLAMIRGEQWVGPGFIGVADFGRWRLICMPEPQALEKIVVLPGDAAAPVSPPVRAACRVNQEMPSPRAELAAANGPSGVAPREVIMAANFSLVGAHHTPAAMLRLPPTARAGDAVALRLDDGTEIQAIVRACAAGECMASGTIGDADWERLSDAKSLRVTFPAGDGQRMLLDLSVDGLAAAIAAMGRAEISTGN
jgi:Invasion associated locus B (IalB) protein